LDLGCGTGNASLAILEMVPAARIFLVDGSENMISVAKEKIAEVAPQSIIGCKVADLSQAGWSDGLLCGEYDAVVSTLVLEHLPFDRYRSAIDQCFALLRPGGWLLAAEGYQEEGSDMLPWFNELMEARRQRLDSQISDYVSLLRNGWEVHYYCSKEQKATWWLKSGFERVNVLWQFLCIALMAGRKPG
jgi:tRNA (cmo5U34)-methyltransferase